MLKCLESDGETRVVVDCTFLESSSGRVGPGASGGPLCRFWECLGGRRYGRRYRHVSFVIPRSYLTGEVISYPVKKGEEKEEKKEERVRGKEPNRTRTGTHQ